MSEQKTPFDEELQSLLAEQAKYDSPTSADLGTFIQTVSPGLSYAPHLDDLISTLDKATREPVRVCVSLPPRHGKSVTILHALAYIIAKYPEKLNVYMTYGSSLSDKKSRVVRTMVRELGVPLAAGSKSVKDWRTKKGGGLISTSMSGVLTGIGITGMLIVDDPIKNREEAESPRARERVWEAFNDVAFTRLEGTASMVCVSTRWHSDDVIGRLQREHSDSWDFINKPAISEKGNALWPEHFPNKKLKGIKSQMGDYSFESLYQGSPKPRGTNVFREPERFHTPVRHWEVAKFMKGKQFVIGVDPAATAKSSSDYSVIMVAAKDSFKSTGSMWIVDLIRKQVTVPALVKLISSMREKYNCPVAVEAVAGFRAVPQMLKEMDPELDKRGQIIEIFPTTDKFTRAQPVASAWNDGRVYVPHNTSWGDMLVDEACAFTGQGDRYDDQVDTLSHCWSALTKKRKTFFRGVREYKGPFG